MHVIKRSWARIGPDKVNTSLHLCLLVSLLALPFVSLQPNRIMPGEGMALTQVLSLAEQLALWPALLLAWGSARVPVGRPARLLLATLPLLALLWLAGRSATTLMMDASPLARVSLGSGFWLAVFWLSLLITDAAIKQGLSALGRLALVAGLTAILLAMLASGHWDRLSLLQEYHNRTDFGQQALRHLQLALGSILPALLVGIPLGVACHRSASLRAGIFPLLNLLQTIPSLAMFGILMIPLSLLAAQFPWLSELGIRGIGATPALIALFFYSLLPIVSNTAIGFDKIDRSVLEAASGMGMNARQRLYQIEFPLAMPVILTGVRVVVTMNIGLVAVAALVGGGGFGTYIFQGLGQTATDLVILGAVPTLLLAFLFAILIDTLIAFLSVHQP